MALVFAVLLAAVSGGSARRSGLAPRMFPSLRPPGARLTEPALGIASSSLAHQKATPHDGGTYSWQLGNGAKNPSPSVVRARALATETEVSKAVSDSEVNEAGNEVRKDEDVESRSSGNAKGEWQWQPSAGESSDTSSKPWYGMLLAGITAAVGIGAKQSKEHAEGASGGANSKRIFDPLRFGANGPDDYINEVMNNFGIPFDKMRWYQESEVMHGRVAMLATFNVILRATPLTGFMPAGQMEQAAALDFMKFMALLEGVRGWRLLVDQEAIAGDLGLGMGNTGSAMGFKNRGELAKKRLKELINGRVAMVAFAGVAGQYALTGQPVGLTADQIYQLESLVNWDLYGDDDIIRSFVLSTLGVVMLADGFKRISGKDDENQNQAMNSIASRAINPLKLKAGVQDPGVPLPEGVMAGQEPQRLRITEEQVVQFEEDGVIMIRGAMADWVGFLRAITEYQIEHPHVWSLVGRMSGLYDYIQRNMWMTNDGFRDFLYYSPLGHVLSQLGRTDEVRVTTDMLLCNPNKGFGWHQDNQNGPIDFPDAMRWWVAMDRCGQDDFGAPEYLLGSHRNNGVSNEAVFVNLEDGDLSTFTRTSKFVAEPGDLIIWNARTIHRILSPPGQRWEEGTQRRAIGGTVAKKGAVYLNKGGASGISDLAGHDQKNGELLRSPYFPRIYPSRDPDEEMARARQEIIGRSPEKIANLAVTLASNAGKYVSFTKVVGKKK